LSYHLLYDEACSICIRFKERIEAIDRHRRIEAVGFMDPRVPELVPGMSKGELFGAFHLVFPDGAVKSGNKAIPDLLGLLPGFGWIGWLLKTVPGGEKCSEKIYAWLAKARNRG
jgi:predicted DCC family thiol-disulfide oxidoreductase YuxK